MAIPPIKKFTEDCWGFAPRWSILYTILRISSFGIPISNLWGCSCTRWPSNTIRQYQTTIGVYHLDVAFYTQFFWLFPGPQSIEHCIFNLCINSVPIMLWLWGAYVASRAGHAPEVWAGFDRLLAVGPVVTCGIKERTEVWIEEGFLPTRKSDTEQPPVNCSHRCCHVLAETSHMDPLSEKHVWGGHRAVLWKDSSQFPVWRCALSQLLECCCRDCPCRASQEETLDL